MLTAAIQGGRPMREVPVHRTRQRRRREKDFTLAQHCIARLGHGLSHDFINTGRTERGSDHMTLVKRTTNVCL